jgi:hypothetical protein
VATRLFISYAWEDEDPSHHEAVRQLWIYLRENGVDARLDLPAGESRQDWALWMTNEVREARFVLIVASPAYRRRGDGLAPPTEGRGVQWEAGLIREEIYVDRTAALRKFIPVLLPGRSVADLPAWLGPTTTTHYDLTAFPAGDTERLLRLLTDQPYEHEPPLGRSPVLAPRAVSTGQGPRGGPNLSTAGATDFAESHLVAPLRRLFLHFFDPHFLDEVSRGRNVQLIEREAVVATRLAVLTAETVFVPAASYIESDLCAETVNAYRSLFEIGQIVLVGGEANIVDFAATKLLQYERDGDRFRRYEAVAASVDLTPPFRSRTRSATQDIATAWYDSLADLSAVVAGVPLADLPDLENRWAGVPARLAGRAFTPEYVMTALFVPAPRDGAETIVARRAGSKINREYFRSYTVELDAGIVTDLNYLHSPGTGTSAVDMPFRSLLRTFRHQGVLDVVLNAPAEHLIELRGDPQISAAMAQSIENVYSP